MDVFQFKEFENWYMYIIPLPLIQIFNGQFPWAQETDLVIMHLLEVIAIMVVPEQINIDNGPAYKIFFLLIII